MSTKSNLDAVIANIAKTTKVNVDKFRRYKAEQEKDFKIECLPTTVPELDAMLGIGGLPWGIIAEIYGPEQSGKTWLSYIIGASAQERGLPILFLDVEGTLNPIRARAVGANPFADSFVWMNEFESGNQVLDIAAAAAETGEFALIVVDSVAALVPKEEIDASQTGSVAMGLHARMMSRGVRLIANNVKNKKTIVVFINQIRSANLGSFMGATEETTGGKALKFYSHVRIRLQARKAKDSRILDKDKNVIGNMTQCRLIKTRYGIPFQECDFPIYFVERKRDPFLEFFTFAERKGLMKLSRGFYRYPVEEPTVKEKEIGAFRDALIKTGELVNIAEQLGFDDPHEIERTIVESSENPEDIIENMNSDDSEEYEVEDDVDSIESIESDEDE